MIEIISNLLLLLYHNCVELSSLFSNKSPYTVLLGCGLIGVAGELTHLVRTQLFKDMLDVCQVRGRDSTGVIKVDKDLDYTWVKQIGAPNVLYESRTYENAIEKGGESSILIGHTRAKTIGEVSVKNAHPFDFEEQGICGVHNGTLQGTSKLDGYQYQKVDSEVLYNHLALNGPEDTFSKAEGAFACVWWNDKEKTLNFIRNDQRPLWFTWSEDMKMMFWASEIWMFGVIGRKVKLWDGGEEKQKYVELPLNTLWSFRINPKASGKEKLMRLRVPKAIAPFVRPVYNYQRTTGGMGFHGASYHSTPVNRWREILPGLHVRSNESETKTEGATTTSSTQGGSVVRPFQGPTPEAQKVALNDSITELFGLEDGETSTPISNVSYLNISARSSASGRGSANTKRSTRNVLSLPGATTKTSPQSNNDIGSALPSSSCERTKNSISQSSRLLCKGVSFREVAGISYITDNRTKDEYTFDEFYMNTGGVCSCCKEFFKVNLSSVGEFLDKNTVLCKTCLESPKDAVLITAAGK